MLREVLRLALGSSSVTKSFTLRSIFHVWETVHYGSSSATHQQKRASQDLGCFSVDSMSGVHEWVYFRLHMLIDLSQ
jgi:hypothetical protein